MSLPIVTVENFYKSITRQDVKDILSKQPHIHKGLDAQGYTYLDFVLYKTKQSKRPIKYIIKHINDILHNNKQIESYM